jgi:antitoxin component of MazEF toxin-antitoxin module
MIKTLTPIGNRLGIIIDQHILEILQIELDTPLEISVGDEGLYIRPVKKDDQTRVLEAADRVMDIHEETLRKLAQ